jgi:hypothetical protein
MLRFTLRLEHPRERGEKQLAVNVWMKQIRELGHGVYDELPRLRKNLDCATGQGVLEDRGKRGGLGVRLG